MTSPNNSPQIVQVSDNCWTVPGSGLAFTEGRMNKTTHAIPTTGGNGGKAMRFPIGSTDFEAWSWGADNNLPSVRECLVQENNIVGELLLTKRTVTLGGGLIFFKRKYVDGKEVKEFVPDPPAFTKWKNQPGFDLDAYLRTSAKNLFLHGNVFTGFERLKGGPVTVLKAYESRHVRAEKQDTAGKVNRFFWCGNWKTKKRDQFPIMAVPVFDETKRPVAAMMHVFDDLLHDDYYGIPTWWGGRKWIELANLIPLFHLGNINNGYLLRYHIEIPKDYFWDKTASAQAQTEELKKNLFQQEKDARADFIKKVNDLLAGADNAGRALFTEYEINKQIGKDFPGIKITAISTDIKDEALLKLFQHSNDANMSGQGVPPALAAIQTAGKLSSGSEIRNSYQMYLAIKTPENRRILLKPLDTVRRLNGWGDDLEIGFRDIEITTLDENPKGAQPVAAA